MTKTTPKYRLIAPNGKCIVGTSETMSVMLEIEVSGRNPDGSIEFEYTDNYKDYPETITQVTDRRGRACFQDEDGCDWPDDKLTLQLIEETTDDV